MATDKAWVEMTSKEQHEAFAELRKAFPVGCRVKVIDADEETADVYIGKLGTVRDYDVNNEGPPLISVVFDKPHGKVTRDGFYIDELERI